MSKFSRPLKLKNAYHEKRHSLRVSFKGLNCAGDHTWSSIWIPINNISSHGKIWSTPPTTNHLTRPYSWAKSKRNRQPTKISHTSMYLRLGRKHTYSKYRTLTLVLTNNHFTGRELRTRTIKRIEHPTFSGIWDWEWTSKCKSKSCMVGRF